jgi:hypothetical protein
MMGGSCVWEGSDDEDWLGFFKYFNKEEKLDISVCNCWGVRERSLQEHRLPSWGVTSMDRSPTVCMMASAKKVGASIEIFFSLLGIVIENCPLLMLLK